MSVADQAALVTPEAVVLDLPIAGLGSRAAAFILDAVIQITSLVVFSFVVGAVANEVTGWIGVVIVLLFIFSILFVYPVAFETALRGRTPGKMATGLRVVTVEGAPVQLRHAAVRAALGVIDFHLTLGGAAALTAFLSARGQRLGDIAAGTVVVRERAGHDGLRAMQFTAPPGTESLLARLDVGAMTEDDYVAVRSLLVRAPSLHPSQVETLGRQVAAAIAGRVRPEPPVGMPIGVYLQCVANRYQQRTTPSAGRDVTAWLWSKGDASAR